jgi:hypothetical protein
LSSRDPDSGETTPVDETLSAGTPPSSLKAALLITVPEL